MHLKIDHYNVNKCVDFELFFQKNLLPKELQKIDPAFLNLGSDNVMRALSPVCREVTEKEKDLIKLRYKLSKMSNHINNERKTCT